MQVSFKGKLISKPNVYKRNLFSRTKYYPKQVSFVELNVMDDNDYDLIKKMPVLWQHTYAKSIEQFCRVPNINLKTYVLTKQDGNYEKLLPQKVLGMVQTWSKEPDHVHIEYLQVHPIYANKNFLYRKYKFIGTALLDCIKNLNNVKRISLFAIPSAFDFYRKNGFISKNEFSQRSLIWQKPEMHLKEIYG